MLCRCSRIIALAVTSLSIAQAADTTLTLACQGTTTSGLEDAKPEPVSMGIIVNFTNRTVQGFDQIGFFGELINYPVKITAWNDVTVVFKGSANFANSTDSIMGHINRVTGDVAGVREDGVVTVSDTGTGQGSVISPLLANVYLHYVFDLWAERWRHRPSRSGWS
jgi:hypothetical protein